MNKREWILQYGNGEKTILVLPRMDHRPLLDEEWQGVLAPFLEDAHFIILDMPEKLAQTQLNETIFTVQELASEVQRFLGESKIHPDQIWGLSLGGMIAQELAQYKGFTSLPLVLISTNLYADTKLKSIFSSWSLMTEQFGLHAFDRSLVPWISDERTLPILHHEWHSDEVDCDVSMNKILASLNAVSNHDARGRVFDPNQKINVFFGKHSVLLGKEEASYFQNFIPHAKIIFVENAGMRIINDNSAFMNARLNSIIQML